jgi:hypothetical protein
LENVVVGCGEGVLAGFADEDMLFDNSCIRLREPVE